MASLQVEDELEAGRCLDRQLASISTKRSTARGAVENRIKETQGDLFADRTSAATMPIGGKSLFPHKKRLNIYFRR